MSTINAIAIALAADAALSALPDAEIVATGNVVTKTPRRDRVTSATILNVMPDAARAIEFIATLKGHAANPQSPLQAFAAVVVGLIEGPGFDAANAKTEPLAQSLINAGLCTREEADTILYSSMARRYGGEITESDVVLARRLVEVRAVRQQLDQTTAQRHAAAAAVTDAADWALQQGEDVAAPTIEDVMAVFDGEGQ